MFGVFHKEFDEIEKVVVSYLTDGQEYLMSKEFAPTGHKGTNGEHIHVAARIDLKQYNNINKTLKDRYGLNGDTKNGTKTYGKIKADIKDPRRLIAYCMKDGDYSTNIKEEVIEELKKLSFPKGTPDPNKKKEKRVWTTDVIWALEKLHPDKIWDPSNHSDFQIITDTMFDMLGKNAKCFDGHMFKKMYIGICNRLETTPRAQEDFRRRVRADAAYEFQVVNPNTI
jgi:hypothetical protein